MLIAVQRVRLFMAIPARTSTEGLPDGLEGLELGDYVQQTMGPPGGRFRLPWYAFAPEDDIPIKINEQGAFKGTYFGPVHEIRDTRDSTGFVSIRVPMPFVRSFSYYTPCQLVWINVYKESKDNQGNRVRIFQSCKRVSSAEVRCWEQQGWWHKKI